MYDDIQSETRTIKCVVLQGSILGPLLCEFGIMFTEHMA